MEINATYEDLAKKKLFLATPMYGGMCAGIYAKSIADLSALCTKLNISLQLYYLFNESLIPRARNYCCLSKNSRIETEEGLKTIDWIHSTNYRGMVLSQDTEGNSVWKRVLNSWKRPNLDKKWVSLGSSDERSKAKLICTDDHPVAVLENILDTNNKTYIEAKNVPGKYIIRNLENKSNRSKENPLFNDDQMKVIIGSLMGDSFINKNGTMIMGHGTSQREYIEYKHLILNGNDIREKYLGSFGSDRTSLKCNVPTTEQTKYLRNIFYSSGKKVITKDILALLDEKSLAFWYMDDGHLVNKKQAQFCTQGFSLEENVLIKEWFSDRWDIEVSVKPSHLDRKDGNLWYIHIDTENTKKLSILISKYLIQHMRYKLPEEFRNDIFEEINNQNLDYSAKFIKEISYLDKNDTRYGSSLYDIEVEDTHNFFANNTLVHNCDEFMRSGATHFLFLDADIGFDPNDVIAMLAMQDDKSVYDILGAPYPKKCISWEKIIAAVNKGMGDVNPNDLDKYVGDFVFNPKQGTGQIQINEPCEVLEIGTGFMMVRRAAMEKFQNSYPQYMYRPDHVRTEHFDGSREIMMFFQSEIDYDFATGVGSKRYLSEDYWFCQKCQKIDIKTFLCPWMKTIHVGSMMFGGSLADLASIQVSATADPSKLNKKNK